MITEQTEAVGLKDVDFQALVRLASTRSHESREAVFQTVSDLLIDYGELRAPRERGLAGDILRHLLADVAVSLRRELSERLASRDDVPESLIEDLARDEISVAEPVLRESPLLSDMTLIEIIHNKAAEYQLAIARRKALTTDVTRALVETDDTEVVTTVIENGGAAFDSETLAKLVEDSRARPAYQAPLVGRADLPETLARRLYGWVAEPIRQHIIRRYDIDPKTLETAIAAAIESDIAEAAEVRARPTRAQTIVRALQAKGALDSRFLLGALYRGNIDVFKEGLVELTGLPHMIVERVVHDNDARGLAILCRLCGAESGEFEKIYSLSRPGAGALSRPSLAERNRLRAIFDGISAALAREVAERWRKDAGPASIDRVVGRSAAVH